MWNSRFVFGELLFLIEEILHLNLYCEIEKLES